MSKLAPLFDWRAAVASKYGPHPTTRHVLLTLALHMSVKGDSCFPSTKTLAEESGLTERTVCTHLERAEDGGWIQSGVHGFGGKGWARNEYRATLPLSKKALKEIQHEAVDNSFLAGEGTEPLAEGTEPHDSKALKEVQSSTSIELFNEYSSNNNNNRAGANENVDNDGASFPYDEDLARWLVKLGVYPGPASKLVTTTSPERIWKELERLRRLRLLGPVKAEGAWLVTRLQGPDEPLPGFVISEHQPAG